MTGRLEGKVAVITGANSGIGRAIVELFAGEGAKLVLANSPGSKDAMPAIGDGSAIAVHCNTSSDEDARRMIATAQSHFGRLDILCSTPVFGGPMAPLHEQSLATWDEVHAANLKSTFLCMKHAIVAMLVTGGGAIVNTTSAAGLVGWKHHSVYGAAKGGVAQLTKSAAIDYAGNNIRINAIAPGTIWAQPDHLATNPPVSSLPGVPLGRWGRGEDIASAALFLASDEAAYITGAILPVDGGYAIGFSGMGAEPPARANPVRGNFS